MELQALKLFYDNRHGIVELEDDVLSIVRQVREIYGDRIRICLEPTTGQYVFSENCDDGTERLIFSTSELDARAITRLLEADSQSRGYQDAYDKMEREQDEHRAAVDEAYREKIRAGGEEIAHALKKDGAMPRFPLSVSVPKGLDA